jgi:basic amino acid/polyamine antiporter, APA family
MVKYDLLGVDDPLATVLNLRGIKWLEYIVSVSAVVAMTSVLLVFQMGQPRIWMSMSRDGLLPKKFSTIHPKYKTPSYATIVTGLVVGIPILFTDENFVLDFTSIGTLFAFVLVCGGVLLLPRKNKEAGKFNMPYINAQWIVPALFVGSVAFISYKLPGYFEDLLSWGTDAATKVPMTIFFVICWLLAAFSFARKWSLIPVLGLITCFYLLTGMTPANWKWFALWFALGLVIYFLYGYRKSRLAHKPAAA